MSLPAGRDAAFAGALGVVAVAFGSALVSQHVYDMPPCPWCVLQRLIFAAIGLAALVGLAWRAATGARVASLLVALLAAAGIATALWQHFVAAASASCALTFADRVMNATGLNRALPDLFMAYASCADAAVTLAGVPYEFFSLTLFVLSAGLAGLAWRRARA